MSSGRDPSRPELFEPALDEALSRFHLDVPPDVVHRLARFLAELDRWRERMNLTGRLGPRELVAHTAESVLGARFLPRGGTGVDLGTGGGFPGVPLAIARPDTAMTWLEPRERRAAFLRHVRRMVPVENAEVVPDRFESLPRASFDFATCRALRVEAAAPFNFLRTNGVLILWTTDTALPACLASAGLELVDSVTIPGTRSRRIAALRRR
jgi:16S rRNA (guanine527-N7)-methyltransferase